jgi:hypothetical protein
MLLRLKITLLAVFVLSTLLGMAATNTKVLLIGVAALGAALVIAIAHLVMTEERAEQPGHSLL